MKIYNILFLFIISILVVAINLQSPTVSALSESECLESTNLSTTELSYTVVTCENPFEVAVNMGQRLHIQKPNGGSHNMLPSANFGTPGTYQYSFEDISGTITLQNPPEVGILFENVQVSFSGSQMSVSGDIVNDNSFAVKNLYVYWHVTNNQDAYVSSWQRYGNYDGQAYSAQISAQSNGTFSETVCCANTGSEKATPYLVQAFRDDGSQLISVPVYSGTESTPVITVTSPIGDPNTTYEGNNPDLKIFASGRVENKISGINTISVTWKDPDGVIVYQADLTLDSNGNFNNEFDNPMYVRDMRDSGKYTAIFKYDDVVLQYDWNYLSSVYEPKTEDENSTSYSISIKNPRIVDKHLETVSKVSVGESVQITAEIKNESSEQVDFTYHVLEEKLGSKVNEAWVSGLLKPAQEHSPAVTFIPKEGGEYLITVSIIQSYENQTLLAEQQKLKLVVLEPKAVSELVSFNDFTCAWGDGRISDSEFIKNIQNLLDTNKLTLPKPSEDTKVQDYDPTKPMPDWVRNNARAYCDNIVGYDGLENALLYLVRNGNLSLEPLQSKPISELPKINTKINEKAADEITNLPKNKEIKVKNDFKNENDEQQPFAYILQIVDENGIVVSLSWVSGSLGPGQTLDQTISWIPHYSGKFTAQVFLWEDIDEGIPLSEPDSVTIDVPEPEKTELTVFTDGTSYSKSDIISLWGNADVDSKLDVLIKGPSGTIVWRDEISSKDDGSFSTLIIAGSPNWSQTGTYTIVVMSGNVSKEAKVFYDSLSASKSDTTKEARTACDVTEDLICVETAKGFYQEGETIVISGKVKAVILDTPVSFQIFLDETLIQTDQVSVAQDGSYTATLLAQGSLWEDGLYLVRAAYSGNIAETTFEFEASKDKTIVSEIWEVDAGNKGTFDVVYTINGGQLQSIQLKPAILGLAVTIDSQRDGVLTLELPRHAIDAKKSDGTDDRFLVFIDGTQVPYTEEANSSFRKITFQFKQGDSQIEIIGTSIVGENSSIISLYSESQNYDYGDTVSIIGEIQNYDITDKTAVTVITTNPEGIIVSILQVDPSSNGKFTAKTIATGSMWDLAGTYSVIAKYGSQSAETTFQFTDGEALTCGENQELVNGKCIDK